MSPEQKACMSRAAVLGQEQRRLDDYRSDLVGVSTEINQLQKRLRELRSKQQETKRLLNNQDRRVRKVRAAYDKQCKKNENCDQFESQASRIEKQSKPTEDAIERIRQEIISTHKTMSELKNQIVPLRQRYTQNKCQSLVPGQTTQQTIDICYGALGEWNSLQQTLNHHSDRLPQLRSSYKRYLTRLDSLNKRAGAIEAYLTKNCKGSPKVKSMSRFGEVRRRAMQLGKDLDSLTQTLTTLRKERITGP
jgi:chromosome segregation ATPase